MANFVKHEPCPTCGSKDNLARYDDGSAWCFGCLYFEKPDHTQAIAKLKEDASAVIEEAKKDKWFDLPDDAAGVFPEEAVKWITKHAVGMHLMRKNNVVWSDKWQQLIFQFIIAGKLVGWQGRNFRKDAKAKCFTSGDVNNIIPIYGDLEDRKSLFLVEDPMSAINIGQRWPCTPLLGCHIQDKKVHAISAMYPHVTIWLDNDKYRTALSIAKRFEMVGVLTKVLNTRSDPKYYTIPEIYRIIQGESM